MGEGEHTIIGKLPRERLNQIASRKLSTLGIPVRLGADRETLEGELALSPRVVHPATGQPLHRARFAIAGHDHLRFLDPPLSALPAVNFFDEERVAGVEAAIASALQARAAALHDLSARLRALQLDAAVDPDRLAVRALVKSATHAFELLAAPDGVRVSRVAPVGGRPFDVPPSFPTLPLESFPTGAALEKYLLSAVPRMAGPAVPLTVAQRARGEGAPGPLEATPPPRNALSLAALARVFGDEATLAPNALVELVQEFEYGGTRYRFLASREMGTRFRGRLIGPNGDVWSDRFELAAFPGTRKVVALALGASLEEPAPSVEPVMAPAAVGEVPQHLLPVPGEVWVMNVMIEGTAGDEVRYVGTDIDGRAYGAARVLKRAEFEAVFAQERGGWRLLVQIDQVQDGYVIYRQLDRARQPLGAPRKMAAAILVANFVPEAAAY